MLGTALAVQCTMESQSRQLKNEGEKIFPRFARTDRHCPHYLRQWPYHSKNASYGPVTLNTSKCKTMLITRKKHCSLSNQFCLTLHSESLDRVYLFKYLRVSISYNHNLRWSAHISDIVARAKRVIGLICRKFYRLHV